jgi:hypothetical protein
MPSEFSSSSPGGAGLLCSGLGTMPIVMLPALMRESTGCGLSQESASTVPRWTASRSTEAPRSAQLRDDWLEKKRRGTTKNKDGREFTCRDLADAARKLQALTGTTGLISDNAETSNASA